jgi:hypothetical protein
MEELNLGVNGVVLDLKDRFSSFVSILVASATLDFVFQIGVFLSVLFHGSLVDVDLTTDTLDVNLVAADVFVHFLDDILTALDLRDKLLRALSIKHFLRFGGS